MLVVSWAAIYFCIRLARGGHKFELRRIRGLDAIEEAIGRATELGSPVFFCPGIPDVMSTSASQAMAGFEVLSFIASKTAQYGAGLVATVGAENALPVIEEVVRHAYVSTGKGQDYKPEMVRFLSPTQMAYTAATIGIMRREKIAACFMVGPFFGEALIIAEAAAQLGAITIAGTARMAQLPLFVVAADYTLLGEEIYAGGAYLSGEPVMTGSLIGQDMVKLIGLGLLALGSVLATFNIKVVADLFKM
jgi:hypothetical protein